MDEEYEEGVWADNRSKGKKQRFAKATATYDDEQMEEVPV